MLGRELHARGRRSDALTELRKVKDVDPRQRVATFLLMAQLAAESNEMDEARVYAGEARKYARRPEENASVDTFLRSLETGSVASSETDQQDDQRPVLRRRAPTKPGRKP